MSRAGHDAFDANGDVQIKMTAGNEIAMYATCERLVVLRVVSPEEAEIVYDGSGEAAWSPERPDRTVNGLSAFESAEFNSQERLWPKPSADRDFKAQISDPKDVAISQRTGRRWQQCLDSFNGPHLRTRFGSRTKTLKVSIIGRLSGS